MLNLVKSLLGLAYPRWPKRSPIWDCLAFLVSQEMKKCSEIIWNPGSSKLHMACVRHYSFVSLRVANQNRHIFGTKKQELSCIGIPRHKPNQDNFFLDGKNILGGLRWHFSSFIFPSSYEYMWGTCEVDNDTQSLIREGSAISQVTPSVFTVIIYYGFNIL